MSIALGILAAYLLIAVLLAFAFGKGFKLFPITLFWFPIMIYFMWPKKGRVAGFFKNLFRTDL